MKVLVCGSRDWTDYSAIRKRLSRLPPDAEIIEGGAPGADTLARRAAKDIGLDYIEYGANWRRDHQGAGAVRNIKMLDREKPDLVIAFHRDGSSGTQHMIDAARTLGIEVEVIS